MFTLHTLVLVKGQLCFDNMISIHSIIFSRNIPGEGMEMSLNIASVLSSMIFTIE